MAAPVDAKLLRQTKFPPEFSKKVDMTKVNIEVMKKWIAGRISDILGSEDDVVTELCFNLLEGARYPDIKSLQIQLTGFLDKDTAKFCKELWSLCLSGQESPQGVPKELLEAKKLELMQEKLEAEKAAEAARRRREQDDNRDREIEDLRRRERSDRGRGRRELGRGGRDGRDRERRRSQSPRDRSWDRYREPPSRRDFDSYVPSSSHRSRRPSYNQSRSPSHSPRRRRPDYSRSPSPHRSRRERRRSPDYGDRDRTYYRNDSSRSRTPRRDKRDRHGVSGSPRHRRPSDVRTVSRSRSRSRSHDRGYRSHGHRRRSSCSSDLDRRDDHHLRTRSRHGSYSGGHRRQGSSPERHSRKRSRERSQPGPRRQNASPSPQGKRLRTSEDHSD